MQCRLPQLQAGGHGFISATVLQRLCVEQGDELSSAILLLEPRVQPSGECGMDLILRCGRRLEGKHDLCVLGLPLGEEIVFIPGGQILVFNQALPAELRS